MPQHSFDTVILILAGGQSQRFAGEDKGLQILKGLTLFDRAVQYAERLGLPVMIAGPTSYQTSLPVLPDRPDGPHGPAAALWSFTQHDPFDACYTIPLDCPFLTFSVFETLTKEGKCTVAKSPSGLHPTVGFWTKRDLANAFKSIFDSSKPSPSLHKLAEAAGARQAEFDDDRIFFNINTAADLAAAEAAMGSLGR